MKYGVKLLGTAQAPGRDDCGGTWQPVIFPLLTWGRLVACGGLADRQPFQADLQVLGNNSSPCAFLKSAQAAGRGIKQKKNFGGLSRKGGVPSGGCWAQFLRNVLTIALIIASAGCGRKDVQASTEKDDAAKKNEVVDPLRINASQSLLDRLTVGMPDRRKVAESFEVAGRVEADATRLARVGSPVRGRITDLLALEGERVHRGQPIASLYSTELSDAQFAFIKAVSQQQLMERSASRGQQLLDADVIGSAELQRRQAETLQASTEVAALRQQLQALGMSDAAVKQLESTRKLNSQYQVLASIDGTVLERSVTVGQIVQPAEISYLIADLSRVWIVADVPEQAAGNLLIGKRVEAEVAAFPGEKIQGKLSFVSSTVSPETRTVRVRMTLANNRGRYKPAMLVSVRWEGPLLDRRTIPVTADVREGEHDNVFVQVAPRVFALHQVTLGPEMNDRRVLLAGVEEGEQVVLDGAFHLNTQRKKIAMGGGNE